ncbi:hypothetical protein [Leeuwenhoekiella marinoflava]|uniref:hypothetical protein n=1 Tax=Leeuwenhoekiella marinoflava TaxID=988 RepID=UPI003001331C
MRTLCTKSSVDFLNTRIVFITKHLEYKSPEVGYPLRITEYPNNEILAVTFVQNKVTKLLNEITENEAFLYAGVSKDTAINMLTLHGFIKPYDQVDVLYLTRLDHPATTGDIQLAYVDHTGKRI